MPGLAGPGTSKRVYQFRGWRTMKPLNGDTRVVDQRSPPWELWSAVSYHSPAIFMYTCPELA